MRDLVRHPVRSRRASLAISVAAVVALSFVACAIPAAASPPGWSHAGGVRVLRVGTWHGIRGQYSSIQSAVNAARPGDWVLVAPGDYHESGSAEAGVMITTPDLHVRGLDRNGVVIDGTRAGATRCSSATADQGAAGRNGIEVFEANGVTLENFTACNFLRGGDGGNQIWWNGGDGTGTRNLASFGGAYLSATSHVLAVGAGTARRVRHLREQHHRAGHDRAHLREQHGRLRLLRRCLPRLQHRARRRARAVLGARVLRDELRRPSRHSQLRVRPEQHRRQHEQSEQRRRAVAARRCVPERRHRTDRFAARAGSFTHNFVHDNNNVSVPSTGSAALGPPGTGLVISGGRTDTVIEQPLLQQRQLGGAARAVPRSRHAAAHRALRGRHRRRSSAGCYFGDWGNEVASNTFDGNGGFANPTNGDLADLSDPHDPGNCWHDNTDPNGITSAPADVQLTHAVCGIPNAGEAVLGSELSNQVLCATELLGPCDPSVGNYPHGATVVMPPLAPQPTMPDPCAGVPANAWCPGGNNRN